MATRILNQNGDTKPLGKAWVSSYFQRNPRVKSLIGRPIESVRINGAQLKQIQEFYDLYKRVRRKANIRVENTWNMDESDIALGACTNSIAIGDASKKTTLVQTPNDREWVSIVEAVSALGRSIRPLVIFKGKYPQSTWFHQGEAPDWIYTTSKNGWIANRIAFGWLTDVFLPETKPPSDDEPRLLLLDGHASHHTVEFLLECKRNNVWLVFLPPHSTHVLQPLVYRASPPLNQSIGSRLQILHLLTMQLQLRSTALLSITIGPEKKALRQGRLNLGGVPLVFTHGIRVKASLQASQEQGSN